jgi:hypothetical protein
VTEISRPRGAMVPSKPPPFKRPSIELGRHGKVWVESFPVDVLRAGYVVSGEGQVTLVERFSESVTVTYFSGATRLYSQWATVRAFVPSEWADSLTTDTE